MRGISQLCLLSAATVVSAQLNLNLLDYGQLGPLLGSSFGLPGTNATFDYVVVGGGNAGLTIASRLAMNGSASVAVVEAGGFYEVDNSNLTVIPGLATYFTGSDPNNFQPLIDWGFNTVPQEYSANRVVHYARGKTLGGSSARNYMLYQRATVDSLQRWADEVDDQSYTFDNLLPYYKKSCHYTGPNKALYYNSSNTQDPDAFSSSGGPLEVSFSNFVDPFGTWARKAFINVGMKQIDGFNSGKLLGSAYATLTIKPENAHRSTSESSFLQEALNAGANINVYKNTMAQKILFDFNKTATGVHVMTAGTFGTPSVNFTLSARKEVIVSAGAFQSPQLLMVSGIGPCSNLSEFGISCISDLPGVGQNMQDHPIFGTAHRVGVNTASASINNKTLAAQSVQLYLNNATGPLSIFGPGYYGWEKLPQPYRSYMSNSSIKALSTFPADWPEIEWLPVAAYNGYNLNKQTADPHDGHNYATVNTALVAPLSRGTVTLAGPDMNTPPIIDPKWLSHPADLDLAVQSFKRQRQVWDELAKLGIADPEEAFPGSNYTTDAQIKDIIGQSMTTVYHASCTCKMGSKNDTNAVLDSSARVYGVQNLRVVDASSFPFLPPGHPQSLIYALAEKIAEDILRG
ncbi:CAZyme family AA3 [Paecilomyces variotii]|nr:CAZyme family AA3 [Paecilomyces variotii]KAJ9226357.1 CAZyme family AA3 [Paecilomyces variotii]KAJ9281402.1 CAZyme family AA3 [Paecilomyces variotii]KAJ9290419.1 CAZyme family AA3 [Paecilomyces variotii]KAJ9328058.1 CAZyme family AA3 [Paecilomyces variotii]